MVTKETSQRSANNAELMRFGPLVLNLSGTSVSVNGRDVPVTYAEFILLARLARDPYSVLNRETLADELQQSFGRTVSGTNERRVDTHIARLRRKLADAGSDCIRTMRNVGYRFVPPQG